MNSSDPFESSKRRIARAKKHIRDLKRSMQAFTKRKPYRIVTEPYTDGIHEVLKLKARRKRLPDSFSDIAADAAENLRASLDHAIFAIAVDIGTPTKRLDDVYFPFARNESLIASRIARCCPNFPKSFVALLGTLKPYNGGNQMLWALNEVCRKTKHRLLVPMDFRIGSVNVFGVSGIGNFALPPKWDSTKNEIVLGQIRPDTDVTCNLKLAFNIGFDDPQFLSGQPAVGILNEMARIVDGVVMAIEAEAKRIGLFRARSHSE